MDKIIYFAKVENNFLKKVLFINIFDKIYDKELQPV